MARPFPGLRDDAISLTHRAVYSDREIVVGFTRCNGTIAPCGRAAAVLARAATRPATDCPAGNGTVGWPGTGAGAVVASANGVQVDLGVWNGERRSATLTAAGDVASHAGASRADHSTARIVRP